MVRSTVKNLQCIVVVALFVTPAAAGERPNIVFILADDLGWTELGCYGNTFNETPHLDRLARQGMRFTDAYAAAPVCSPYRAALLTGQYPARVGILDYLRPGDAPLSTEHVTIAEMLKGAGYATGMIGKWHLTGYRHHGAEVEIRPTDHGFDTELVCEIKGVGNGANFFPYVFRTQPISWLNVRQQRLAGEEYLVDRMNFEAVQFIEANQDRPFFLYLSHYAVHTILNGKPELVDKYRAKHAPGKSTRNRCYLCEDAGQEGDAGNHWAQDHNPHLAAMLESIDDGVGMIVNTLERLKLADNTIVIFTSDNGGETNVTSNAPLRAGKSSLYEGGIRVPLVIRWPNTVPAGAVCNDPTTNIDFYPTLLECAGVEPDPRQHLDGVSIFPLLKDPKATFNRTSLYWHYPLDEPHFLGGRSSGAIRQGDWKLIEFFDTDTIELYNLAADPGEKRNLADQQPTISTDLKKELTQWRRDCRKRGHAPNQPTWCNMLYFQIVRGAKGNALRLDVEFTGGDAYRFNHNSVTWSHDARDWQGIRWCNPDRPEERGDSLLFPEFEEDVVFFGAQVPLSFAKKDCLDAGAVLMKSISEYYGQR